VSPAPTDAYAILAGKDKSVLPAKFAPPRKKSVPIDAEAAKLIVAY